MNCLNIPSLFLASTPDSQFPNLGNVEEMSNGVVSISEALSKYGTPIVIMAVFFVIFMILIVIMLFNNTRMINQIMNSKADSDSQEHELMTKLMDNVLNASTTASKDSANEIAKALSAQLKETLTPLTEKLDKISSNTIDSNNTEEEEKDDYHRDIVGAYIDINMAFKDISRRTLEDLDCDRIGIYVFHNGNTSIHGLPFFKMSCIHEWTKQGCSTLRGKSHSDLPLHVFSDFIEDIYNCGYYKCDNVNASEYESIKEFVVLSNHTKAIYMVGVKDTNGSLVGFVDVEFARVEAFGMDIERNMYIRSKIDDMIAIIAPIIGNKYVYKKN